MQKPTFKDTIMLDESDFEEFKRRIKKPPCVDEGSFISSFFTKNEEKSEFKYYINQDFNKYLNNHPKENYNLSYLLDRIHNTIDANENQNKNTTHNKIPLWESLAVASLLLVFMLTTMNWFTNNNLGVVIAESTSSSKIISPLGSRISFSLPDGTQGWLNGGSSIEYSIPFINKRLIYLTGEAWFDVKHDPDNPFEVISKNSRVRVLGTKFNLNAYPDEKYMELVLEEGKVELSLPSLPSAIEMNPNERLLLKNGTIDITKANISKYSSWKEGKLIFNGDTMDEVARSISRWYNVNVEVVDEELKKYSFRGTFQNNSLEEVIRFISMTSPIHFQIIDNKQSENDVIQRRRVLLYKKDI